MRLEGGTSSRALALRLRAGEALELTGAFSEGVYFSGPGGAVMVHDVKYGSLPFGVAVPGFSGRGRRLGLSPGDTAELGPRGIELAASGLFIAVTYSPARPSPAVRPAPDELERLRELFRSELAGSGRAALLPYCGFPFPAHFEDVGADEFARAGAGPMRLLHLAMARPDAALVPRALSGLLGLGRGLTPSFDDFVTGLLAALNHASAAWGLEHPVRAALAAEVSAQAPLRTNRFSAAYLLAAADGGDFSMLRECLEPAPAPELLRRVRRLLLVGGSSGADMLSGMAFALGCILTMKHL